jgi:hypothetical protein
VTPRGAGRCKASAPGFPGASEIKGSRKAWNHGRYSAEAIAHRKAIGVCSANHAS